MTNVKTKSSTKVSSVIDTEIPRGIMTTLGVGGIAIGLWSFASVISAMVVAGGPISLTRSLVGAIIGV